MVKTQLLMIFLMNAHNIKFDMITNNNFKNEKQHDIILSGYIVKFNEPDLNFNIISNESINLYNLQQIKNCDEIIDYEIYTNGIKVIKRFNQPI